jgi:ectoine hydroxylase-related dioxygenase (phytanoyl-CoA dioxygenase family)
LERNQYPAQPAAVPLVCDAGDVAICNRQAIHGSFANTSPDIRVTINFGFQRRKFILGATGNGIHSPQAVYDADRIFERSKVIAWAIDAREQRFPDETPFDYKPFEGVQDAYCYTSDTKVQLKDYNLLDLGI